MPIYEYKCPQCGTHEELRQHYLDGNIVCESCDKIMTRIVSKSTFKLVGDTWESDGYGSQRNEKA